MFYFHRRGSDEDGKLSFQWVYLSEGFIRVVFLFFFLVFFLLGLLLGVLSSLSSQVFLLLPP